MQITVDENSKIVAIWLTNAEKNDTAFRESLKPLYKKYHDEKFKVAVFMSGEHDLHENTLDLLLHNRRRAAEREMQAEQENEMTMQM